MAMHDTPPAPSRRSPGRRLLPAWCAACLCAALTGCAALTNPVAEGLPVRRLPPELLGPAREDKGTLPLTLLRQKPVCVYRLAPGDELGVWIPGVLGEPTVPPPMELAPATQIRDQRRLPPGVGYPVPVREDGTVLLPLIDPVVVDGLTVPEAHELIRQAYAAKKVLQPGAQIIVTLLHPRQYHVVVMRQESGNITLGPSGEVAGGKRGTGHVIDLPAYENDVLHALAGTGGLPGLDAYDEVVIHRGCFQGEDDRALILGQVSAQVPGKSPLLATGPGETVRIPLRLKPGENPPFRAEDVVLHTGDVVFVEARDPDVFYTGGLLPAGEFVMPRDRDLDVVEAVTQVRGALLNGAFATSNLSGALLEQGVGNPSPSLLTVLRRTPGGGSVPIRVDLNKALCDARERILVQPGDVLILQETPGEALARYTTRTFLNFSVSWEAIHDKFIQGIFDVSSPQQLPNRITYGTLRNP
jgi:protein involved in polysaccharide export with SLBB domain